MKTTCPGFKIFGLMLLLAVFGCTDNPASPASTSGTVKFSVKSIQAPLGKVSGSSAAFVTLTSVQVVIEEIEFESTQEDSLDFELEEPFVQDLVAGDNLHVIANVTIPFGSYKEIEIEIDKLSPEDSTAYAENPELQGKSVLVKGYLSGDPNETFEFSSALEEEQEMEFDPPFVLDENSPTTNIVMTLDMDSWFVDEDGNFLDPRSESNRSKIEQNIKNSVDAFEDDDDNGEDDDD